MVSIYDLLVAIWRKSGKNTLGCQISKKSDSVSERVESGYERLLIDNREIEKADIPDVGFPFIVSFPVDLFHNFNGIIPFLDAELKTSGY